MIYIYIIYIYNIYNVYIYIYIYIYMPNPANTPHNIATYDAVSRMLYKKNQLLLMLLF